MDDGLDLERAKTIHRDKASIHETAEQIMSDEDVDPMLVLRTMWWIVQADGKVDALRHVAVVCGTEFDEKALKAFALR